MPTLPPAPAAPALSFAALYWQQTPHNRALRAVCLLLLGVAALTASAHTKVPYYPVPQTLQTLVVLLLPFALGGGAALAAVLAYLALGGMGAPVFAAGGGWAYLVGPTGGFLLGFVAAAALLVWCMRSSTRTRGWWRLLLCLCVADALIFLCGLPWLALALGSWQNAWALGALPFAFGEASKIAFAAAVLLLAQRQPRA